MYRARTGRHRLVGLLRQSLFGQLTGYEDVNDAERLCRDPAMRWMVGDQAITGSAASATQMGRFETRWLSRPENLRPCRSSRPVDRERSPVAASTDYRARHGFEREPDLRRAGGRRYNGHFGCTCYHPLFVFNQFGDVERCALRPGNVHSADGWRAVLEPMIVRYRGSVKHLYFRGDAAFANPEMYEVLEAEQIAYQDPVAGQRCLAAPDRLSAETPGRATTA
jgi:hypothetical protein